MCQCAQVLPPRPNERAGRGRISDLMIVRAPFVPVRPSATAPAKRTGRPRPHLLPITPVLDGLPSRRDFLRPQPHKKRQPLGRGNRQGTAFESPLISVFLYWRRVEGITMTDIEATVTTRPSYSTFDRL